MIRPSTLRRAILGLLAAAVVLFVTLAVLLGLGRILTAMGDLAGGRILDRIGLGFGVLLFVDLVCLVLVLAIGTLGEMTGRNREDNDREV